MYQLFSAIKFVHENNYIHHDIKPENIFFLNKNKKPHAVIADFELAQRRQVLKNDKIMGSVPYLPPEVLTKQETNDGKKIDCWALGIIMYMLLYNTYPFYQKSNSSEKWWNITKIKNADFSFEENLRSKSSEDLIKHLLCKDPKKRFSVEDALNHEWFFQFNEKDEIKSEKSLTLLNEVNKGIASIENERSELKYLSLII